MVLNRLMLHYIYTFLGNNNYVSNNFIVNVSIFHFRALLQIPHISRHDTPEACRECRF